MADKSKAQLEAENEQLQKELAQLRAGGAQPDASKELETLRARNAELETAAKSGNPFTGAYQEQFTAKLAAGLSRDQAGAVVREQMAHDQYMADLAKKTEAAKPAA